MSKDVNKELFAVFKSYHSLMGNNQTDAASRMACAQIMHDGLVRLQESIDGMRLEIEAMSNDIHKYTSTDYTTGTI